MRHVFPLQPGWRLALYFAAALGVAGLAVGIAGPAFLEEAPSATERIVAAVVGGGMLAIGAGALPRARCTIQDDWLHYLDFHPLPQVRELHLENVVRWGHAVASNQGRRDPLLLFELRDRSKLTMKLGMYRDQAGIRALLAERLGTAAPAKATMAGIAFDGDA